MNKIYANSVLFKVISSIFKSHKYYFFFFAKCRVFTLNMFHLTLTVVLQAGISTEAPVWNKRGNNL